MAKRAVIPKSSRGRCILCPEMIYSYEKFSLIVSYENGYGHPGLAHDDCIKDKNQCTTI